MDREIEKLIHAALHGELDDDERRRLSAWVASSRDNARAYYRVALDEQAISRCLDSNSVQEVGALADRADDSGAAIDLAWLVQAEQSAVAEPVLLERPDPRGRVKPSPPVAAEAPNRAVPRADDPIVSFAGVRIYRGAGGNLSLRRLALAAMVFLAGIIGVLVWSNAADRQQLRVQAEPEPQPTIQGPALAGTVSELADVAWSEAGRPFRPGDPVHVGDSLMAESGLLCITAARGARVTIEGPFKLTAVSDNCLRLDHGRLVAQVPPEAMHFTIETPIASVIDFGTEFGVEVGELGQTDVAVFEGEIELAEADGPGADGSRAPRARQTIRLSTGWASSVTPDVGLSSETVGFDPEHQVRFARSIEAASDPVFRYRRAVRDSRPIAYWDFEGLETGRAVNRVEPGRYDLDAWGAVSTEAGVVGDAVGFFRQEQVKGCMRAADPIRALADANTYSVSVWCKMDRRHMGRIVGLFVYGEQPDWYQQAVVLESTDEGAANNPIPQTAPRDAARFLHRDPPGVRYEVGTNAFSPDFTPGRWTQFVAVKHPDRIELYRDGRLIDSVSEPGRIRGIPHLMVGLSASEFDSREQYGDGGRPFQGLIDELVVYDRPLSREEVAHQYLLGSGQE